MKTNWFFKEQSPYWYKECAPHEILADRGVNRAERSKRLLQLPSTNQPYCCSLAPFHAYFRYFDRNHHSQKHSPVCCCNNTTGQRGTTGLQSISQRKIQLDKVGLSEFWFTSICCSRMMQRSCVNFLTMTNAPQVTDPFLALTPPPPSLSFHFMGRPLTLVSINLRRVAPFAITVSGLTC